MKDKLAFYVGEDKELSIALQKLLFKLGYRWNLGENATVPMTTMVGSIYIVADQKTKLVTWAHRLSSEYENVAWVEPIEEEEDLYLTIFNEKDGKRNIIKLNLTRARELGLVD